MIERIKSWFGTDESSDEPIETIGLYKVEWDETIEIEETDVTVQVGWSGGPMKTITYTESESTPYHGDFYRRHDDGRIEQVIDAYEEPAFIQEIGRETWTRTVEHRKTAWVTDMPPDTVMTADSKMVVETEDI